MAIKIIDGCINCGACKFSCPNYAIYEANEPWDWAEGTSLRGHVDGKSGVCADVMQPAKNSYQHYVVPEKCTECLGFFVEPQCALVCPIGCCVLDDELKESRQELLAEKKVLHKF